MAPGHGASAGPPRFACYLCKRKFPTAETLKRHNRLSELHKSNLEKRDEAMILRKEELRLASQAVRMQLFEADAQLNEQTPLSESAQQQRTLLDMRLKQLLGEYGQAQQVLEESSLARQVDRAGSALPTKREARVGKLALSAASASWTGNKDTQEDRFVLDVELDAPDGQKIQGFCVLDGHSGSLCVDALVERLPSSLQKCLSMKPALTEEHLAQAVVEACVLVDDEFLVKARQQEVLDGSTMILGLVYPEDLRPGPNGLLRPPGSCRLLIANVGDSRAVLCRSLQGDDGEPNHLTAVRLSDDHKPLRPDEQRRIEARGGVVDLQGVWRVFTPGPAVFGGRVIARWGLAVSRAFGDLLLKEPERFGCTGVLPGGLITAVPEIRVVDLHPTEDKFLILACDGIWDVLNDDDAVATCAPQASTELAASALVRRSYAAGSDDNLTALVVTWRPAD